MPHLDERHLRTVAFEVSVIANRDFLTDDHGLYLSTSPGSAEPAPPVLLSWQMMHQALAPLPENANKAQMRHALLGVINSITVLAGFDAQHLQRAARPYALPCSSVMHPGPDWVMQKVLGKTIDLGLAFDLPSPPSLTSQAVHTQGQTQVHPQGLPPKDGEENPSDTSHTQHLLQVVPPCALEALGHAFQLWWPKAAHYLHTIGQLAADHMSQQIKRAGNGQRHTCSPQRPHAVLHPYGNIDVVSLLGSSAYRKALADLDGSGLCTVAVPMRRRGWIDLRTLDPAFIPTAYELTERADRGFAHPLLVTAEEVVYLPQEPHAGKM